MDRPDVVDYIVFGAACLFMFLLGVWIAAGLTS